MRSRVLAFDVTAVVLFAAAGRATHERDLAGVLGTAAPFLVALVAGWALTRAWQSPATLRAGYGVAVVTITVGLLLRRLAWGDGTALSFVVVTIAVLSALILGWRVALAVARSRRA